MICSIDYQSTLPNNPEEQRPHLYRGKDLKSCKTKLNICAWTTLHCFNFDLLVVHFTQHAETDGKNYSWAS